MRYAIGILCLVGSLALLWAGLRPPPKPVAPPVSAVDTDGKLSIRITQVGNDRHSLGAFRPSERREIPIWLENHTGRQLAWASFQTSCECLEVRPPSARLDVDERLNAVIVIDLNHTPEFRGGLLLTADSLSADSVRPVFTLELLVDVD